MNQGPRPASQQPAPPELTHNSAQIDADVKEAKGILAYMRRCCLCFLFSCCCDCDPSKKADETRQQRVEMYVLPSVVTAAWCVSCSADGV